MSMVEFRTWKYRVKSLSVNTQLNNLKSESPDSRYRSGSFRCFILLNTLK